MAVVEDLIAGERGSDWSDRLIRALELGRVLTSSLDLTRTLESILSASLELVTQADAAAVFLYDAERGVLVPQHSFGFDWRHLSKVRLRPGEGMTGQAFAAGEALLFGTNEQILAATANMSPEHRVLWKRSIPVPTDVIRSCIAAPLLQENRKIGVLLIENFRNPQLFDRRDLFLAQCLATYAAVALGNAAHFSKVKDESQHIRELNIRISQQNLELRRSAEVHSCLIEAMLEEAPLAEMVQRLATTMDAPVALRVGRTWAAWSKDMGEASLDAVVRHVESENLGPRAKYLVEDGQTFLLCPLRVGSEQVGVLVVRHALPTSAGGDAHAGVGRRPRRMDLQVLEQAAALFSLRILQDRQAATDRSRGRDDFLRAWLARPHDPNLLSWASSIGLDPGSTYVPLVLDIDRFRTQLAGRPEGDVQAIKKNLLQHIEAALALDAPGERRPITFRDSDSVIGLVCCRPQASETETEACLKTCVQRVQAQFRAAFEGFTLSAALGVPARGLKRLATSLSEAQRAIRFAVRQGRTEACVLVRRLGALRLVLEQLEDSDSAEMARHVLDPLLELPGDEAETLLTTLRVYVEENGRARPAARRLFIHPNTMYQRLHKIQEILDMDLSAIDDWTAVAVAVMLLPFTE